MAELIHIWRLPNNAQLPIEPLVILPAPASLDEGTHLFPGGGYTTFRTFNRFRVLRVADHFQRLEETARLAGKPLQLDRQRAADAIHQALAEFPAGDMRVRMILDLEKVEGDIYLLIEPLRTPAEEQYRDGVRVLTRKMHRENPKAKLTGFIETASAMRQEMPKDINEIVMIGPDDRLLEGLSSNFFGVRAGTVYTADEGVLSGITRQLVLETIREQNLPLCLEGVPYAACTTLDEAFLTSASRAVLPVVGIDGVTIADGKPGAVTRILQLGYQARMEKELDII